MILFLIQYPSMGPKPCGFCCAVRGEPGQGAGRGSAVTGHKPTGHQGGAGMAAVTLSCFGPWVCSFQIIPKSAVDAASQDQKGIGPA